MVVGGIGEPECPIARALQLYGKIGGIADSSETDSSLSNTRLANGYKRKRAHLDDNESERHVF